MRFGRFAALSTILLALASQALAAPFVLFPKAGRLVSPDGRFEVRDADRPGLASDFVGAFHSVWLTDLSTGRSRKLCDYMGVAAVAWSGNDFLVLTQYVGKKTSRALVFAAATVADPVMLDKAAMIEPVGVESRETLRGNDHVFVEASRLENGTFFFRVWGYGPHDPNGFRWDCQYSLGEGKIGCPIPASTTFRR